MKIGRLWNKLANPNNVPRLFAFCLAVILIVGFVVPMALNPDQLQVRPSPQLQAEDGVNLAPYDRGGEVLKEPVIVKAQYPENSEELGMISAYMSPLAQWISSISPYFGTSIYSSPGGLIDEVLYYTRGFDTILESSILMMSFVIASWLTVNYTMNRRDIEKDIKKAASDSAKLAREVKVSDEKSRLKQLRRDN